MAGNGTQQSGQDENRPANGSPGRQIVVVPRTPGPLRVLDDAGAARGDDLDATTLHALRAEERDS